MVMETYYRRRSKKALQQQQQQALITQKMEAQQQLQAPVLGRHQLVPTPPSSHNRSSTTRLLFKGNDESEMAGETNIEVGCLYEIDHVHLPPRTPVQLRCIRVAMVCEKTEMTVGVRYPSMESLRAFFTYSARQTHPALDEKFVMGTTLAGKVLLRLVPPEILSEHKSLQGFWLISSDVDSSTDPPKKGGCLLELKGNGMMRWGIRRQVRYLGRHRENAAGDDDDDHHHHEVYIQKSSSSIVNGIEEARVELLENGTCDDKKTEDTGGNGTDDGEENVVEAKKEEDEEVEDEEDDEENEDDDDDDEEVEVKLEEDNKTLKRKYHFRNLSNRKPKRGRPATTHKKKKQNQPKKNKPKSRFKQAIVLRNPKDRWSSDRYKLAEQNLLDVMKAKSATAEKPILRPQLRLEARKRIGDTGLLDHLLKHMAGKIAPGGDVRFRRRHNADGAMEYWLEDANLVLIRRDAGVSDPYWVPPTGWKMGDSPTQDPTCAREFKLLKDEVNNIKRELELRTTKEEELEEEVGRLRREIDELSCKRREEESQIFKITSNGPSEISQKLALLGTSLVASKSDLEKEPVTLERYKEQLLVVSDFVKEIEAKIGILMSKVEERDSALITMAQTESRAADKVKRQMGKQQQQVQSFIAAVEESSELGSYQNKTQTEPEKRISPVEQKAEKIERLKSGFRICKPQGTFLWPNMVMKNNNNKVNNNHMISSTNNMIMLSPHQAMVQVEVPTPPSVSSSSASAPPQLPYHHYYCHPASPVKPVAEKRAVKVTLNNNVSKTSSYEDGSLIDLNDAPIIRPTIMPRIPVSGYVPRNVMGCHEKQQTARCSSSISSFPNSEVVNWLALSNLKSSSDESGHGDLDGHYSLL